MHHVTDSDTNIEIKIVLYFHPGTQIILSVNLSNGPAKKQAEKQQPAAIASVIFQALISLIKLNLNALIGQCSEKREI